MTFPILGESNATAARAHFTSRPCGDKISVYRSEIMTRIEIADRLTAIENELAALKAKAAATPPSSSNPGHRSNPRNI
jgi:hypothetical protein